VVPRRGRYRESFDFSLKIRVSSVEFYSKNKLTVTQAGTGHLNMSFPATSMSRQSERLNLVL
jgi:hypothetical protein